MVALLKDAQQISYNRVQQTIGIQSENPCSFSLHLPLLVAANVYTNASAVHI